jgi:hypothetical protein
MTKFRFDKSDDVMSCDSGPSLRIVNYRAGCDDYDARDGVQIATARILPKRGNIGGGTYPVFNLSYIFYLSSHSRHSRHFACAAAVSQVTAFFESDGLPVTLKKIGRFSAEQSAPALCHCFTLSR